MCNEHQHHDGEGGCRSVDLSLGVEGFKVEFVDGTKFSTLYQRNNKSGGLKNLRCFPSCSASHKERGFCGQSIKVYVDAPSGKEVVVYSQFLPVSQVFDPVGGPGINPQVNDIVNLDKLKELERTPQTMTKPFILGQNIGESMYEFNRKLKGWAYGWTSNKHNCNQEHVFQVYVFEKVDENKLQCKAVRNSSAFKLFCRRRKRFTVVPTAPISPVNHSRKKKTPAVSKKEAGLKRKLNETSVETNTKKLHMMDDTFVLAPEELNRSTSDETEFLQFESDLASLSSDDTFDDFFAQGGATFEPIQLGSFEHTQCGEGAFDNFLHDIDLESLVS